jgi:hypothetical protein
VSFVVIAARYTRSPETPGRWVKTNEKWTKETLVGMLSSMTLHYRHWRR